MDMADYFRIEKEQIKGLAFNAQDVLSDEKEISIRQHLLQKAQQLGNQFKNKVLIQFYSNDGPKEVHTTIWDVSSHYVTLKGGIAIPIHTISTVSI